jgi:hypothetical protein
MGAWGSGPFDNDDALDFVADLETTTGHDHLGVILGAISDDPGEYVESPESSAALAAAEVVAALLGRPNPEQPEDLNEWVAAQLTADPALVSEAIRAVRRIAEKSELRKEMEAEDVAPWEESLAELLGRLGAN